MSANRGFTLVELLIVIMIIGIVSIIVLPNLGWVYKQHQMSAAARTLQATIEGAKSLAAKNDKVAGLRFLPDDMNSSTLTYSKIIQLEVPDPYFEGKVTINDNPAPPYRVLRIEESVYDQNGLPNARTNWFWNIRVGEKIRVKSAGNFVGPAYTIIGPTVIPPGPDNPEGYVNVGPPDNLSPLLRNYNTTDGIKTVGVDFLYLVNGINDNEENEIDDPYIDNGWDNVDNDNDGSVDEIDEREDEQWLGNQAFIPVINFDYLIERQPCPLVHSRITEFYGVSIDATTWNTTKERSNLAVNPYTKSVDLLFYPDGRIKPSTIYTSVASLSTDKRIFFWISPRGDVHEPLTTPGKPYQLPMPVDTVNYTSDRFLKDEHRIVSLSTMDGSVRSFTPIHFDGNNIYKQFTFSGED